MFFFLDYSTLKMSLKKLYGTIKEMAKRNIPFCQQFSNQKGGQRNETLSTLNHFLKLISGNDIDALFSHFFSSLKGNRILFNYINSNVYQSNSRHISDGSNPSGLCDNDLKQANN